MVDKVLTPHMLRKKLYEVNQQSRTLTSLTHNSNNTAPVEQKTEIEIKTITQVQGNNLITDTGEKVVLYNPLPGVNWTCTAIVGNQGIAVLEKPLEALILYDGDTRYCIGFTGETSEFELTIQIATNKVTINKDYVNITANHLIKNGLEEIE